MQGFLKQSDSQKWGSSEKDGSYILTIADMDLPLHEPFRKAILSRLNLINNFTYKNPSEQYLSCIADWWQRYLKQGGIVRKEDIVESPSILNMIYLMVAGCSREGDGVLLLTPVFSSYSKIVLALGRKVVESRLYKDRSGKRFRYEINFTDLEEKAKTAKMILFCNPHNPTGRVWSKKQVQRVAAICHKEKILMLSDEILADFAPTSKFYSAINVSNENLVVCNSISKAFNSQSLKGGYAIIRNSQLRQHYESLKDAINIRGNEFARLCTEVFYSKEGEEWLSLTRAIIWQNYSYLTKKANQSQLVISELESAFIIIIDFQNYVKFIERWYRAVGKPGESSHMVAEYLKTRGIVGVQIPLFGQLGVYCQIRFTIATETEPFKRFVDHLLAGLYEIEYQFRAIDAKL